MFLKTRIIFYFFNSVQFKSTNMNEGSVPHGCRLYPKLWQRLVVKVWLSQTEWQGTCHFQPVSMHCGRSSDGGMWGPEED